MSRKAENNFVRVFYVLLLGGLALYLISPFLIAIFFGATVALALYPLQLRLEFRGLSRKISSLLLTVLFGIIISIPFSFFVGRGVMALTGQLEKFQTDVRYQGKGFQSILKIVRKDLVEAIQKYSEKVGVDDLLPTHRLEQSLTQLSGHLLRYLQEFLSSLPTVFLFLVIMLICTYSFLKRAEGVRVFFTHLFGFSEERMNQLIRIFIMDSRQVYISNILTGSTQSLIVATGVSLLGLGDFFLVFFVTLILSFIPVIGAAPVAFLFGILAFFQDMNTKAFIIIGVGIFTGLIDNFMRPYLATLGGSNIPPVPAFVCVIGGALLFGFPGLFIGLLVGAIAYDTLPIFWEELGKRGQRKVESDSIRRSDPEIRIHGPH